MYKARSKVRAIGFSLAMILVYLLNHLLLGLAYGTVLAIRFMEDDRNIDSFIAEGSALLVIVASLLSIIIYAIILFFKERHTRRDLGKSFVSLGERIEGRDLLESGILFLSGYGVASLSLLLVSLLAKGLPYFASLLEGYNDLMGDMAGLDSNLVAFVSVVVLAPIIEELLFRGLIYGRLRQAMGTGSAIFLSSLVFGVFHGNVIQGIYAFFIGLILATVYERTDSLLFAMLGHGLINLIGFNPEFFLARNLYTPLVGLAILAIIPSIVIIRKWWLEDQQADSFLL